jgi:hypothetical protein
LSGEFERLLRSPQRARLPLSFSEALSSASGLRANLPACWLRTARAEPRGTSHVRALHTLLLKHLSKEGLEVLDQALVEQGYKGPFEMRLLEHCVRTPDPVAFVAGEFARAELLRILRTSTGGQPDVRKSASALAVEILAHLGFPRPVQVRGLKAASDAVEGLRQSLIFGSIAEIRGAVTTVGTHLEYLCKVLLRFISIAAFNEPPERLFERWGKLKAGQRLTDCGLGMLFGLVEELAARLEREDDLGVRVFRQDFRQRRVFPDGVGHIAQLRNAFSHFKEKNGFSDEELKQRAHEFLENVSAFVVHLNEPESRIFPRLVLVDEIRLDRWGRKVVRVVDDEARSETVFTDTSLEPGEVYFMHPLTNPLRVDPILVPAGDLAWAEPVG